MCFMCPIVVIQSSCVPHDVGIPQNDWTGIYALLRVCLLLLGCTVSLF